MARYLIGVSENAWNFEDAYNAASAGDILEFEAGCVFEMKPGNIFQIEKDITICGAHVENEDGSYRLKSYFNGSILVKNGACVNLECMNIIVNADIFAVGATDNGILNLKDCIVGNKSEQNQRYLVHVKQAEMLLEGVVLKNISNKITGVKTDESKVNIKNSGFNSLFVTNNSVVNINASEIENPVDTAITCKNSQLSIAHSYIKNSSNKYTAFFENSKIEILNSEFIQKDNGDSIFCRDCVNVKLE